MVYVLQFYFYFVIHRLEEVLKLRKAKFVEIQCEWKFLFEVLRELCKRHTALRLSKNLDKGLPYVG